MVLVQQGGRDACSLGLFPTGDFVEILETEPGAIDLNAVLAEAAALAPGVTVSIIISRLTFFLPSRIVSLASSTKPYHINIQ